ncbi:MAG: tetratricopeptide repeat protein [Gemmatimonadota bacterium]
MSDLQITVVIPTYNQSGRLRLGLAALGGQTFGRQRYEVLVIDDGCEDDTVDTVLQVAAGGAMDLRLLANRANRGRNAARNLGISQAKGELIVFLDGDALPAPDLLERYWEAYCQHGRGVVMCGYQYCLSELEFLEDPESGKLVEDVPVPSVLRDFLSARHDRIAVTAEAARGSFDALRRRARPGGYPFDESARRQEEVVELLTQRPGSPVGWVGFIPHNGAASTARLQACGGFDEEIPFSEGWDLAYRLLQEPDATAVAVPASTIHLYHYHRFADEEGARQEGLVRYRAVEHLERSTTTPGSACSTCGSPTSGLTPTCRRSCWSPICWSSTGCTGSCRKGPSTSTRSFSVNIPRNSPLVSPRSSMAHVHDTERESKLIEALQKHERQEDRRAMALDCYQLGALYQEEGGIAAAVSMFRRALVLCESLKDSQGVAAAYTRLGLLFETQGDLGQARFYLEESRRLHDEQGDQRGLARDCGYLGLVSYEEGDYAAAEDLYRKALALDEQVRSVSGRAEDLGNLGNLYATQGRYDEAEEVFHRSLKLYAEAGDRRGLGGQYRSLGNLWLKRGDGEQARTFFELGLGLHRELGWQLGMALAHDGLGQVCELDGRAERAEEMYGKALELFQAAGHKQHVAATHRRLGALCWRREDHAGAGEHLEEALDLCEEMGDRRGAARCCKRLGDIYMSPAVDDVERAGHMYSRALAAYQELRDEQGVGSVYAGLGNLAARQGEVTQAIAMWTAASERFRRLGDEDQARQIDVAMKRLWGRGRNKVA